MAATSTARRVRKSPAERLDEVAEAARAIALADGLGAVTLRAVAARMGVASGLVAHYAPSMDDLVADTFAAIVAAELREVELVIASGATATDRLRMLLHTVLDGSRDDIGLVWVQAWAAGARNDALAAQVRAQMDDWQGVIEREISSGVAAGEFSDAVAPASVAWHLLAMIDGLNAHSLVRWGQHPDQTTLVKRSLEALLGLATGSLG
ncbi:TetR/AcrR family transcriptional regulator [Microbacterium fluvii]|uniref:TetR/AcrR family transcriptional regulator n=1 Tax=Microbacterium fluvii TaxID=415215 RepID=A0ABW2HDU1_9MICO|nr:TetR family transcriptional regulator C-terminal domain-containing protein [Microbacterium fluvii]MCU4673124.1 TetR family transcriptional regulator C-terminal domain-containing protein [Microbacterium fluvii]